MDEWETVLKMLKSHTSDTPPPESAADQLNPSPESAADQLNPPESAADQLNPSPESMVEHRLDLLLPGSLPGKESPSVDQQEELDNSDDLFS